MVSPYPFRWLVLLLLLLGAPLVDAASVRVAVASNFLDTLRVLTPRSRE